MTSAQAPSLVAGAVNFRDTGGLAAASGVTRAGVLYRSGNLASVSFPEGADALRGLGLRRIIDLRSDDEVRHSPSLGVGSEIDVQRVPLFLGSVSSFFEQDLSLSTMYRALVDDSANGVVEVVRGILADQPVLVHCTVGKDRTGVTVALALAAAGVDEEAVIRDYARTEALLPVERNRDIIAYLRAQHPESKNLEDLATRSPAPVMRALLADLSARYGSPAQYLRASGLDHAELAELRRVLISED